MKSIIRKLSVYVTVGTLGMFSLVGCSSDASDDSDTVEKSNNEQEEVAETKYFDVGEHLFFERYYLGETIYAETITGGSISIPEGYSVYDIENFNELGRYGTQTGGYDVWFLNDVPVEAEKVYNEVLDIYDYSEPGTSVLEKTGDPIQKVK